jgi:hypothetical protein
MPPKKSTKSAKETKTVEKPKVVESGPIKCPDFKIEKYFQSPITDNSKAKGAKQYISLPRYHLDDSKFGSKLSLVTKEIQMSKGGIPQISEFYKTDQDCLFFWLPLLESDANAMELYRVLKEIDDINELKINTEENSSGYICLDDKGKKLAGKLIYISMIKEVDPNKKGDDADGEVEEEDKKDEDTSKPKYKRVKVRFSTVWDSEASLSDPKKINTKVHLNDGSGKPKKEPEPITCLEDIRKLFSWNCKAKFVLDFSKLWIGKSTKSRDPKVKTLECGMSIKCNMIYVSEKPVSSTAQLTTAVFDDGTSSDNENETKVDVLVSDDEKEENQDKTKDDEDEKEKPKDDGNGEDDKDEEDEEEDEVEEEKAKVEDADEEEDDDEKKKTKEEVKDEEDEEDEEPPKKVKEKKEEKKPVKGKKGK